MRFQPILLMTLPPGDDEYTSSDADYTRPATPGMPNATGPMPSPYLGTSGAPPPPPATRPAPTWRPAGQLGYTPAARPTRPTGLLIVAGLLIAVALVALGSVALVLAQHNTPGNTTTAHASATNTPKPTMTKAPTATPTTAPTDTPTGDNNQIPQPPDGFVQYIEQPGGLWGLDIPNGMNPMQQTAPGGAMYQQQMTFPLPPLVRFDVFDLSQPVAKGQFTAFWQQIMQAVNVPPGIQVDYVGQQTYSLTWQVWQTQSSFGQIAQVKLLYHKHGDQATAIAIVQMGGDSPVDDTTATLKNMLQSFTYLT